MVPLIELRGALPVAYGIHTANPDFSLLWSYIIIAIGNMLPVPFIYFFARKVLEWGKDVNYGFSEISVIGASKKVKKAVKSYKPRQVAASIGHYCSSSASRCPALAPGQVPLRPVSWTWTSRRASWRSLAVLCWPA